MQPHINGASRGVDHSYPSRAELQNRWSNTSKPQQWLLTFIRIIRHRESRYFPSPPIILRHAITIRCYVDSDSLCAHVTVDNSRRQIQGNIERSVSFFCWWIYCLVPGRTLRACLRITSAIDLTENFASAAHPLCVCVPTYIFKNHIQLFEYRTEISA